MPEQNDCGTLTRMCVPPNDALGVEHIVLHAFDTHAQRLLKANLVITIFTLSAFLPELKKGINCVYGYLHGDYHDFLAQISLKIIFIRYGQYNQQPYFSVNFDEKL